MKTKSVISLILIAILFACENIKDETCEAIVVADVNSSGAILCNDDVYTLKIIQRVDLVESLIGSDYEVSDSVYNALNLPEELRIVGLKIKLLKIRALEADEMPACYNFEMPLMVGPTMYIIQAEKK